MADFTILYERLDWLGKRNREVAATFAARAALRVVPLIDVSSVANRKRMLRVFRAVAAAWAAAAYLGHRDALREAARAALFGLGNLRLPAPVRSAVYAAATVSAPEEEVSRHASTSIGYALDAAKSCGDEAFAKTLEAIEIDAGEFQSGFSSVTIALAQLWPNRVPHPERGAVYALATIKNVSIVLIGAAAAATPAVIGALLGSTLLGAVLGAPITLVAVETVKKNPAFNALVTQLGVQLDKMSDVELRNWLDERARRFAPFRSFVVSNEEPLRKIAESTSELKWMLRYIDFVVAKKKS
jgi:hypothetical protein